MVRSGFKKKSYAEIIAKQDEKRAKQASLPKKPRNVLKVAKCPKKQHMARRPLKRIGTIGKANIISRKKIGEICEEKNLNRCELNLAGCMKTWPLAPAHLHKRAWYKGDVELLADFNQWVVACQVCHDQIEFNAELTEQMFLKLRP